MKKQILTLITFIILLFLIQTNVSTTDDGNIIRETVLSIGLAEIPVAIAIYIVPFIIVALFFIPKNKFKEQLLFMSSSVFAYLLLITFIDSFATTFGFLPIEEKTYNFIIQAVVLGTFMLDVILAQIKSKKLLTILAYTPIVFCGAFLIAISLEAVVASLISILLISVSLIGFGLYIKHKLVEKIMKK